MKDIKLKICTLELAEKLSGFSDGYYGKTWTNFLDTCPTINFQDKNISFKTFEIDNIYLLYNIISEMVYIEDKYCLSQMF